MQGPGHNEPGVPPPNTVLVRGEFEVGGVQRTRVIFDMAEKSVLKSMDSITTDEIMNFTNTIEAIQGAEVVALLASLFDFMGFDPIQIIKKLLAINKYYREEKKMVDETIETLKVDIMMIVSANIIMGNLQTKSVGRRSQRGRAALEYLQTKYDIRIGSTGAGLPSDQLTFPRVANSFPVLTCRTASVLPKKDFPIAPFKTRDLPKFMRVSSFASFLHETLSERTRTFLLEGVCAYSCDQMVTVHEGEKKKRKVKKDADTFTGLDAWNSQWDYISVSSTSPVPSLAMKKAMITEFLLENLYNDIEPIVRNVRDITGSKEAIPSESEYKKDLRDYVTSPSPTTISA